MQQSRSGSSRGHRVISSPYNISHIDTINMLALHHLFIESKGLSNKLQFWDDKASEAEKKTTIAT